MGDVDRTWAMFPLTMHRRISLWRAFIDPREPISRFKPNIQAP